MDVVDGMNAADRFLEKAGHKRVQFESAEMFVRIVANTGFLHKHETELLMDMDGHVVYFGPVRELLPRGGKKE